MIILFPLLRWGIFRNRIPRVLNPPKVNPKDSLVDPWGGIFGTVLFIVVIILLITLSAVGLLEGVQGVWSITAPAGIIMFLRDCWHDWTVRKEAEREKGRKEGLVGVKAATEMKQVGRRSSVGGEGGEVRDEKPTKAELGKEEKKPATPPLQNHDQPSPSNSVSPEPTKPDDDPTDHHLPNDTPARVGGQEHPPPPPSAVSVPPTPLLAPIRLFTRTFPTPSLIITRLPLQLIPFAFAMFILVESLSYTGWIRVFATWWTAWVDVGGLAGAIWLMGMISVLGCNAFGTNIGATVLLSRESCHVSCRSGS